MPLSGATLSFYRAGTTSQITIYQDAQATTPHANPVVADSAGTFPPIFIDTADAYKFILKTALGVTVQSIDGILGNGSVFAVLEPDLVVGVYAEAGAEGLSEVAFLSSGNEDITGKERYVHFIGAYTSGTGDGTVPGSTYGLGITSLKENWQTTTRQGQMHGLSIVTRGGFHGANPVPGGFYNPGDTAGIVINTQVSSDQSFAAAVEGTVGYAKNGSYAFSETDPVHQMRFQIAGIREVDNPGFGYLAVAEAGNLGPAFLAQNRVDMEIGAGSWNKFLSYFTNFGAGAYEAFSVNQIGNIVMDNGPAAAAPNQKKLIRVGTGGKLEVVNSAGSAIIFEVANNGSVNIPTGAEYAVNNVRVVGPRVTGWEAASGNATRATFATGSVTLPQLAEHVKALVDDMIAHGLIGA